MGKYLPGRLEGILFEAVPRKVTSMSVKDIFEAVVEMRRLEVAGLVRAEIEAGTGLTDILNQGLITAMDEVGSRFSQGEIFVPEMLMAANAMKSGLEVIKPLLIEAGSETSGTVVIGTVKGDLHDIGKNLVAMMRVCACSVLLLLFCFFLTLTCLEMVIE